MLGDWGSRAGSRHGFVYVGPSSGDFDDRAVEPIDHDHLDDLAISFHQHDQVECGSFDTDSRFEPSTELRSSMTP